MLSSLLQAKEPAATGNSTSTSYHQQRSTTTALQGSANSEEQEQPLREAVEGDHAIPMEIAPHKSLLEQQQGNQGTSDYRLPKCQLPPAVEFQPVESFVWKAIQSRHTGTAASGGRENDDGGEAYRAIVDTIKRAADPATLRNIFLALRVAGKGQALTLIAGHPKEHAQLIHWIFRFHPLKIPKRLLLVLEQQQQQAAAQGQPQTSISPNQTKEATTTPSTQGNGASAKEEASQGVTDSASVAAAAMVKPFQDGSILDAHLHLILALVSAKSVHLVPALTNVWKTLSSSPDIDDSLSYRLHAMLCTLARMVPQSRTDLFPIMAANFPFWNSDHALLCWNIAHSVKVLDYLPSLRKEVLELIIDKCLELDVHIEIADNGVVQIEAEEELHEGGGVATSPPPTVETNYDGDRVNQLSDKLDAMLSLLLETIQRKAWMGASNQQGDASATVREIYRELAPVFENTILTTYKSKFVQYCMFLICGLESRIIGQSSSAVLASARKQNQHATVNREFTAKLVEIIVDPYCATMTRQSAVCYLASFISRASFVESGTLCEAVATLLRWAEAYIASLETDSFFAADSRDQTELHALFYTVCQGAFYIMSFRGPEALGFFQDAQNGYPERKEEQVYKPAAEHIDLSPERWTAICEHQLQPLRYCLESVRSEFLHLAHAFGLIEEKTLDRLVTEAKRMSTGRVNKKAASAIATKATLEKQRHRGGVGGMGRGANPLKSFFPFDPLLLRRSHVYIESLYKQWEGPIEEEDILVLDDGPEMDEGIFEMDEDRADNSDSEVPDVESVGGPVMVSDGEREYNVSPTNEELATVQTPERVPLQNDRKVWTENMKRPRSQSMENGSW